MAVLKVYSVVLEASEEIWCHDSLFQDCLGIWVVEITLRSDCEANKRYTYPILVEVKVGMRAGKGTIWPRKIVVTEQGELPPSKKKMNVTL